jgi:hypothetical protein
MNKGSSSDPFDGNLTEDELSAGVQRGIITRANVIAYKMGQDLPNGMGRDVALFRRKLQG